MGLKLSKGTYESHLHNSLTRFSKFYWLLAVLKISNRHGTTVVSGVENSDQD